MSRDDVEELGADLYQEMILDHYKNPRNAGVLSPNDIAHDGDNPTCGDMVQVYARLDPQNRIKDIRFQGKGCAISQASASIFYEEAKGKKAEDLLKLNVEDIQEMLGITLRPARVKCATLGLVVLKEGIKDFQTRNAPKKAVPGFKKKA